MDEVSGDENFAIQITFQKTGGIEGNYLSNTVDYVLWYFKKKGIGKFRILLLDRKSGHTSLDRYDACSGIKYACTSFFKMESK
jgi:adenine-specific DNA-methyltransferase